MQLQAAALQAAVVVALAASSAALALGSQAETLAQHSWLAAALRASTQQYLGLPIVEAAFFVVQLGQLVRRQLASVLASPSAPFVAGQTMLDQSAAFVLASCSCPSAQVKLFHQLANVFKP